MMNYLLCPNCGECRTHGELCNLACTREWLRKLNTMWRARRQQPLKVIYPEDVARLRTEYEAYHQRCVKEEEDHQREVKATQQALLAAAQDALQAADYQSQVARFVLELEEANKVNPVDGVDVNL
jgi:hypothetical protein